MKNPLMPKDPTFVPATRNVWMEKLRDRPDKLSGALSKHVKACHGDAGEQSSCQGCVTLRNKLKLQAPR
jgi:hypothetical protein